jgi:hypothetical protein
MKGFLLILISMTVLATPCCAAQSGSIDGPPVPDVDDRMLQEKYHIPLTEEGLLAALHHPVSDVRSYVAGKLAAEAHKDAIPAILAALAVEPVPGAQVLLARAAGQLGSNEAVSALRSRCSDQKWSYVLRMMAASAMLDLGHKECLEDVLEALRSGEEAHTPSGDQDAVMALNMIPRYQHLTPQELEVTEAAVAPALQSPALVVRLTAGGYTIPRLGDTRWAIEQLRNALAVERDEMARKPLEAALRQLVSGQ